MGWKDEVKLVIKKDLLAHFQNTGGKAGDMLSRDWLYKELMPSLSAKEVQFLDEAVAEMIHEGVIEYVGGSKPTYRLTKKGEQALS